MHFVFIPYGKRYNVELLLRAMEAQCHPMIYTKGKEKKLQYIQGVIRTLPFGVCEYIMPKESMIHVLRTIMPTGPNRYNVGWMRTAILRKIFGVKKIPVYEKKGDKLLWIVKDVNIIPIGIREDKMFTINKGDFKGWRHEAI